MQLFDELYDLFSLLKIKRNTESLENPIKGFIEEALAQLGIEANIDLKIEVLSVNLETFRSFVERNGEEGEQ